jgi:hypothetical protein
MPDPLMGFALQSFPPLVQPYTVSDVSALMTLEQLPTHPRACQSVANAEAPRQNSLAPMLDVSSDHPSPSRLCSTRESATPRRLFRPTQARSSPELSPLQGVLPHRHGHGLHRASPLEVTRLGDESTNRALCRVFLPGEVGLSLSRLPTLLGFTTF